MGYSFIKKNRPLRGPYAGGGIFTRQSINSSGAYSNLAKGVGAICKFKMLPLSPRAVAVPGVASPVSCRELLVDGPIPAYY